MEIEAPPTPPLEAAPPGPPLPTPDIFYSPQPDDEEPVLTCESDPELLDPVMVNREVYKPGHYLFRKIGVPLPRHYGGHGEASHDDIVSHEKERKSRVRQADRKQKRHEACPEILRPYMLSPKDTTATGLRHAVDDIIASATPDAANKIIDLMECEDKRVALNAAMALLDRAFGKPEQLKKSMSLSHQQTVVVIRDGSEEND